MLFLVKKKSVGKLLWRERSKTFWDFPYKKNKTINFVVVTVSTLCVRFYHTTTLLINFL